MADKQNEKSRELTNITTTPAKGIVSGLSEITAKGLAEEPEAIKPAKPSPKSVGQLTVDFDCSEALTGLKAIQREAKKATQALRELEAQQKRVSADE